MKIFPDIIDPIHIDPSSYHHAMLIVRNEKALTQADRKQFLSSCLYRRGIVDSRAYYAGFLGDVVNECNLVDSDFIPDIKAFEEDYLPYPLLRYAQWLLQCEYENVRGRLDVPAQIPLKTLWIPHSFRNRTAVIDLNHELAPKSYCKTNLWGEYDYTKDDDCLNGRNQNCKSRYTIIQVPISLTQELVDVWCKNTEGMLNKERYETIVGYIKELTPCHSTN